IALHEALAAPFGDADVEFQGVAVGRGLDEAGMGVDHRRADHAQGLLRYMPGRHAALDEEMARGGVDPAEEIGEPDDARRVAVAELDAVAVDDFFGHVYPMRPGSHSAITGNEIRITRRNRSVATKGSTP